MMACNLVGFWPETGRKIEARILHEMQTQAKSLEHQAGNSKHAKQVIEP